MPKISVMIVDDDRILLDDIISQYNWQENGFSVIGTAVNGIQALAIFKEHRPQLVISDIVMPGMNGIELLKEIKSIDSSTSVLLLTSHDDFTYAKEGLKYAANDYILKSEINPSFLSEKLDIVKRELQSENKFNTFLKQKIINDLFRLKYQSILSSSAIDSNIQEFIHNTKYYYIVIELKTPLYSHTPGAFISEAILDLICDFEIENLYIDVASGISSRHILILIKPNRILSQAVAHSEVFEFCNQLSIKLVNDFKIKSSFLYNATPHSVIDFYNVFSSLEIEQRYFGKFSKGNSIIDITSLISKSKPSYTEIDIEELKTSINNNNIQKTKSIFEHLQSEMSSCLGYDIYSDIVTSIFTIIDTMNYQISFKHMAFPDIFTYQDFFEWALNFLEDNLNTSTCVRKQSIALPIKLTIEYINTNFQNPKLSINAIANNVYLSSGYLCTLFKNETGQSLNEFITDVRIKKAMTFLRDPSRKVYQIASLVGYSSSQYFSQIFQKHTGLTPTEYKRKYDHETKET